MAGAAAGLIQSFSESSSPSMATFLHAKELVVASATLIIYDHVVTLDQEVALFWSGLPDASRVLYLSIRYIALIQACVAIKLNLDASDPTSLKTFLATNIVLMNLGAALCQAVITLRVWYLFSRSKLIRIFSVSLYIICTCSTWVLMGALFDRLLGEIEDPNLATKPTIFALPYVPSFIIHTVLFSLKIYKYMTSDRFQRSSSLLAGFLKEGLVMYGCATGSLLFTIITLVSSDHSQLDIYFTGLQGEFVVAATVVSVCHALLSIRSLSATLHVDPAWLLNHAELSRVKWTTGDREGEILVGLEYSSDTELVMANISQQESTSHGTQD